MLNGFDRLEDFYYQVSAIHFPDGIRIPTFLVNAQNDPILSPECFPRQFAENHPYFFLEMPALGDHLGFIQPGKSFAWSEYRALEFALS